jgi:hypothetical protein
VIILMNALGQMFAGVARAGVTGITIRRSPAGCSPPFESAASSGRFSPTG